MTESETPSPYDERVELPDAERVERALKTLREFARRTADSAVTDTRSDRSARWRDTPLHNTVDGLLDGLGLERDDVTVERRVEQLQADSTNGEDNRRVLFDALETIESEHTDWKRRTIRKHPHAALDTGVDDAVRELRDVFSEDRDPTFSFSDAGGST